MSKIRSFDPIIDENSRVLILGSMPSVQSLKEDQYYGNPRNQFWQMIYKIFGQPIEEDYEKRVEFIKDYGIALWDVIESCHREGSLDSNIKEDQPNDFNALFRRYPNIKAVFFNGSKAHDVFKRKVGFNFQDVVFTQLPSSSPAHTMKIEKKIENWRDLLNYVN